MVPGSVLFTKWSENRGDLIRGLGFGVNCLTWKKDLDHTFPVCHPDAHSTKFYTSRNRYNQGVVEYGSTFLQGLLICTWCIDYPSHWDTVLAEPQREAHIWSHRTCDKRMDSSGRGSRICCRRINTYKYVCRAFLFLRENRRSGFSVWYSASLAATIFPLVAGAFTTENEFVAPHTGSCVDHCTWILSRR